MHVGRVMGWARVGRGLGARERGLLWGRDSLAHTLSGQAPSPPVHTHARAPQVYRPHLIPPPERPPTARPHHSQAGGPHICGLVEQSGAAGRHQLEPLLADGAEGQGLAA